MKSTIVFFYLLLGIIAAATLCDRNELVREAQDLKNDINSLNDYDSFINKLEDCMTANNKEDFDVLVKLSHQVYYKNGLIQLSAGKYFKAMSSFEKIIRDPRDDIPLSDSYYLLAAKRLQDLYVQFGLWDNVANSTRKILQKLEPGTDIEDRGMMFKNTLNEAREMLLKDVHNDEIETKLEAMKSISPYSIEYLNLAIDFLSHNMIEKNGFDITRIMMMKENFETILDVHMPALSLNERLTLHHKIALIQFFFVGQDPLAQGSSSHLRKCLNIDMDYNPCKELIMLASKLNKANPDLKEVRDEETYKNLDVSKEKWIATIDFYLKGKGILKSTFLPDSYKDTMNNYELLKAIETKNLNKYFGLDEMALKDATSTLFVNIDVALCQAASLTKVLGKKEIHQLCQNALNDLGADNKENIKNSMSQGVPLSEETVLDLRNTYPHMFAIFVKNALRKFSKDGQGQNLLDQILKIWEDNNLKESHNPYLKSISKQIEKILNRRREEQAQRQRQQQQFFQQQQQQQQQQRQQRQFQQENGLTNDQAAKNYYKILGVKPEANSKEIRRAYLDLTKRFHPDKQGKKLTEEEEKKNHEKMSEINEAYEVLNDDNKRKEYDSIRTGPHGFNGQKNFKPNNGRGGFPGGGFPGGFPFGGGFGF